MNEVSSMSEEQSVLNTLSLSFSVQTINGEVKTSPTYRLLIDVSYGSSVGSLAQGYYVHMNDSVYFVTKQAINVITQSQAEKVFTFLHKSQVPFTISVKYEKTRSGYQHVQLNDVVSDTRFYTLKQFQTFRGLWRTIEGVLYENKNSVSITRFSDGKLDWILELNQEDRLSFTQGSNISASLFATQGHLEVFKMPQVYTLPYYFYLPRKKLTFFNHSIQGDLYIVPLGSERRIVKLSEETTVTSPDHDPVLLPAGEYLLFHPRPRPDDAVD